MHHKEQRAKSVQDLNIVTESSGKKFKMREIHVYAKNKQKTISGTQEKARKRSECFLYFLVKTREAERGDVNTTTTTTYYKQIVRRKR